jgi:prepilin-type N-terminal cleavage/methylation domain-containing protein
LRGRASRPRRGFSLIELLIGLTVLSIALLAIATMFHVGYSDVSSGATTTMATEAGRQILEEARTLPFGSLDFLDGYNTGNAPPTLDPADPEEGPALAMMQKWRYVFAGVGTPPVGSGWVTLRSGRGDVAAGQSGSQLFEGAAQISVVTPATPAPPVSDRLRLVTVRVLVPGRSPAATPLVLTSLIARMS